MKARELMTSNPEVVTPDEAVSHAARMMKELDVGAMPVVEDTSRMRLIGILTDRDLAVRHVAEGHAEDCPVRHHMTRRSDPEHFFTARPEDTAEYVMELMARHKVRRIPVVDRGDGAEDRLVGVVALADVAREIGPHEPAEVVNVLRAVSAPEKDLAPVATS